ncbi:MAG: hypothetical protein KBD27_03540 [Candidatus Moranbacteria bacterium]|nr:hypothetical protein [Candidatus Moranbacteria bacterium]
MGLFSGFGTSAVSPTEYRDKVRRMLREQGLSERDVDHVTQVVQLGLEESGSHRGLDRHEIEQVIRVLRENRDAHSLTNEQIETVEKALLKYL